MKKRFIPVVLAALLAFGAAGCDNGKEPGPGPEPTPTPVAQYEVSITNKDVLSGEWRISDGAKKVEIATNPQANIASLIADEVLEITSSNPAVATVLGQNINPVSVGKTTITVRCGDSVDSVEVEILARQHGTFEEDPLTVAEAVTTAKALEQGATSTIVYYVKGIVKSNTWDASYKNGTMWLKDGDAEFELYRYGMDDKCSVDPTTITPGMIVTAYGNIQNFQGKTFEMTQGCKVVAAIENTIPCTALTATPEEMSIEVGAVGRIAATVTPETTTDKLSYTVEEAGASVASVDKNGRVTGLATGTAKVTVKCGEQTDEVTVTVTEPTDGAKTLEKLDYLSADGILPTSKPSAAQTKVVEQKVPGQTETIKAKFEGQWCLPGSYENSLQSNNATDYIHGDAAANLFVQKIRIDVRKYVNVEVYASDDCTGSKITAKNITGKASVDEHVINEYTVNSKTWSIKANYDGASYLHWVELVVDDAAMEAQFTGLSFANESVSLLEGQSFNAAATAKDEGVTGVSIAYESSAPEVVSVDANGNVKALAETGNATITATGTKDGVTKTATMTVNCAGNALPVADPQVNTPYYLAINQANLKKMIFSDGKVSGNYGESVDYPFQAAMFEMVAVEGGHHIKGTLPDGSTVYMNAEVSGDYTNVKFGSEAKTVWTVDKTNRVIKVATTGHTTASKDGEYYVGTYNSFNTISMSTIDKAATSFPMWFYTLGARPAATSVTVDPAEVTLAPEGTKTLKATVLPAEASQTVTWASDATSVATVDANGKVTAVADGTAHITATAKSGVVGTCTVTVDSSTGGSTEPVTETFKPSEFANCPSSYTTDGTEYNHETDLATYAATGINSANNIRGNKNANTGNFNMRVTAPVSGYYVSKVVIKVTSDGGTIDVATANRSVLIIGSSAFAKITDTTVPSGTQVKGSANGAVYTWTNTTTTASAFILYNLKTSGTVVCTGIEVTWTPAI